MRAATTIFLFMFGGYLFAEEHPNDTTSGKVFEALDNWDKALDKIERTPHAVVCRVGVLVIHRNGNPPTNQNKIWVSVKRGNESLQGRCDEWRSDGRVGEFWGQKIVDNGRTAFRYGRLDNTRSESELGKEEDIFEAYKKHRFASVKPFEMALTRPSFVRTGFNSSNRHVITDMLRQRKFVLGKFTDEGIEGTWHIPTRDGYSPWYGEVVITFGKEVDYLPIKVKWTTFMDDGKKHMYPETIETEWQEVDDLRVPGKVVVMIAPSGNEQIWEIEQRWKLGDSVKSRLIDFGADDWFEETRQLFDETWQREGFSLPLIPREVEDQ
ncbi:hypothetical protein FYK55_28575 [Roseiconus nitratireducens]|uniref:Uncharacterized protein n=1 Tax=Roseiconus nitratireducens TaxID=2605748 RepID=A0A5M6CJW6_9BACT|nr:hypothetical protein [Roseiconus nitratireducens]KAA5535414.1 hypothetical protein FYK55_28575 [Roseiconus nitratireducens]